jgi:xanthine dehydrogenase YagT iron-sulfur-binding subunit
MTHTAAGGMNTAGITLEVNGATFQLVIDSRTSLLDLLRERLGLTGSKKGCDHGQCGACTVLIDGRRANSCLALAVAVDGAKVTTVEGLAPAAAGGSEDAELHPLQDAFIRHDAFQCGYCTPGQLCSAAGMLTETGPSAITADLDTDPALTPGEIRERMSGNLCRCGAYVNIVRAITSVVTP